MEEKVFETIRLDDGQNAMVIVDQTLLPNETKLLYLTEQKDIWAAIKKLQVRGAPAIGIAAAIGLYLAAKKIDTDDYKQFYRELKMAKDYLSTSRPTAVNLFWALERMEKVVIANTEKPVSEIKSILLHEAENIIKEDEAVCRHIGEHGLSLLKDGFGLLTHCNAGRLAAYKYGTALAPIYLGHEKGWRFKVFADETRPLLQGARLTAYELLSAGIDTTLICDHMASVVMKNGWINAVVVGCDRVAANGDAANKIGTSGLAILAKHYGIPFYICAPTSTIDRSCKVGDDIVIEERPPEEVTELWYQKRMAPKNIKVYNPAFDVTEHGLITALITEYGVIHKPGREAMETFFNKYLRK